MFRKLASEWIGTFSLLVTVLGSGIMAERLAGGNVAIALLGNTIPTGAILVVLILVFGPISGAHLNPAVNIARGFSNNFAGIQPVDAAAFVAVQLLAACLATLFFKWLLEE
jgi:glycerol uptake facilitator-like aquaporin